MSNRQALYRKKRYGVFGCLYCHTWNISNLFQKGHVCTNCGRTIKLEKVDIVFGSDNVKEAQAYLQDVKKRDALKRGTASFISADKL